MTEFIESTKRSKERQGPTLGVHLIESQLKGERKAGTSSRCSSYRESTERSKERMGPSTLDICLFESKLKGVVKRKAKTKSGFCFNEVFHL